MNVLLTVYVYLITNILPWTVHLIFKLLTFMKVHIAKTNNQNFAMDLLLPKYHN